jgi:Autotransporter beta-domain
MRMRKFFWRGSVALAALNLACTAQAQSFTVPSGQDLIGNFIMADAFDVGRVDAGGSLKNATDNTDAVRLANANQAFTVIGQIIQTGNQGAAVFSTGMDASILNQGSLFTTGDAGAGNPSAGDAAYGIFSNGDNAAIDNQGTIETQGQAGFGIVSAGANALVRNSGTISTSGLAAGGVIMDGAAGWLENSGTIESAGTASFGLIVGDFASDTTITNAGRIMAPLDSTSAAILVSSSADNTFFDLRTGSLIQGAIIDDSTSTTVNIERGQNTALTFNFNTPTVIANGAPNVVTGSGLVAVVDPTGFGAQDEILADFTGEISDVIDHRLANSQPGPWSRSFGGYRNQHGDNLSSGFDNFFGGLLIGNDRVMSSQTAIGVFGGATAGTMETNSGSESLTNQNFVLGGYSSLNSSHGYLDLMLAGGLSNFNSDRSIANNLVQNGIEHAVADYSAFFLNPSMSISTEIVAGKMEITPSLRARYAALFLPSYEETGSAANLAVASRNIEVFELRGQLAIANTQMDIRDGKLKNTVRVGLEGRFSNSPDVSAELLGTPLDFAVDSRTRSVRGFLGLDQFYTLSNGWLLNSSAELGLDDDLALTATGHIGLDIQL